MALSQPPNAATRYFDHMFFSHLLVEDTNRQQREHEQKCSSLFQSDVNTLRLSSLDSTNNTSVCSTVSGMATNQSCQQSCFKLLDSMQGFQKVCFYQQMQLLLSFAPIIHDMDELKHYFGFFALLGTSKWCETWAVVPKALEACVKWYQVQVMQTQNFQNGNVKPKKSSSLPLLGLQIYGRWSSNDRSVQQQIRRKVQAQHLCHKAVSLNISPHFSQVFHMFTFQKPEKSYQSEQSEQSNQSNQSEYVTIQDFYHSSLHDYLVDPSSADNKQNMKEWIMLVFQLMMGLTTMLGLLHLDIDQFDFSKIYVNEWHEPICYKINDTYYSLKFSGLIKFIPGLQSRLLSSHSAQTILKRFVQITESFWKQCRSYAAQKMDPSLQPIFFYWLNLVSDQCQSIIQHNLNDKTDKNDKNDKSENVLGILLQVMQTVFDPTVCNRFAKETIIQTQTTMPDNQHAFIYVINQDMNIFVN